MIADYLIIGQGICGTWLSYYLLKENKSIIVIDKKNLQSASNVAGGLINPVTGRRVVTTWMADELMPCVWNEYNAIGNDLNETFISQKNILVFPSAPDLQQAFNERMQQQNSYIQKPVLKKEAFYAYFNFPFDVFEISPCYVVQMHALLNNWRWHLQQKNIFIEEEFDENLLEINADFIQYKKIQAKKIIYADGVQSAQSKYWKSLPFALNKGQALIVEIDGLKTLNTYKFGHITLINLKNDLWWAGSSNELSFQTAEPTENFKASTGSLLKSILKKQFIVKEHWSALRAATVERRPFAGFHPLYKNIGILNGTGSKGCSLAPWFAKELVQNIVARKPINASADVKRFSKILMHAAV